VAVPWQRYPRSWARPSSCQRRAEGHARSRANAPQSSSAKLRAGGPPAGPVPGPQLTSSSPPGSAPGSLHLQQCAWRSLRHDQRGCELHRLGPEAGPAAGPPIEAERICRRAFLNSGPWGQTGGPAAAAITAIGRTAPFACNRQAGQTCCSDSDQLGSTADGTRPCRKWGSPHR